MNSTTQPIPQPDHATIAHCAQLVWEQEGRPTGRAEQHWLEAEAQLKAMLREDQKERSRKTASRRLPAAVKPASTPFFAAARTMATSASR